MTETTAPRYAPTPLDDGPGALVHVPMRWGDMDVYGHINNVEVVRMLEEARIAAFGIPVGTGEQAVAPVVPVFDELPDGTQALVVEQRVRYVRPVEYRNLPAPARVRVVKAIGATMILGIEILDAMTGETCVKAHTQLAFFDPEEQTVRRMTAHQRQVVQPYVGPALLS